MAVDEVNQRWADISDVYTYTGETATEQDMARAQDMIDLFSGTTFSSYNNLTTRNLRILNRAVAYQAGWMIHRPDLYTHMDVSSISQDGASHTPATANAQLLAPMAQRWLSRLTWANQPWRVRRGYGHYDMYSDQLGPRDSAAADDMKHWFPL